MHSFRWVPIILRKLLGTSVLIAGLELVLKSCDRSKSEPEPGFRQCAD
ncbi:MAG: hypothetical protein HC832_06555 [Leptolyngbyaceae cyanobacterium RM1_405_57]|nr:hypothetical protein [Leptolyngbyaceae cyanobacterium RM1_405_57]